MMTDDKKHKVWLSCMKLSNCTPGDAVNFINMAEDLLFEPITPTGQNILMVASSIGAYFVVRECILHGAQVNTQDAAGRTALHYAASTGNINIFE
jgi:ankyrin repeat protein